MNIAKSTLVVFLLTIPLYAFFWQQLSKERDAFLKENYMDYTLPSRFTGPAVMEFKGIASDFLFLKVITFLGEKIGRREKLGESHYHYLRESIDTITDLDPYFWDAYLFADMLLTWGAGRYEDANKLLIKASKYRTKDYRVPYYIAFNYFYFMHDNEKGAKYLMEASRLPGSPYYLATLAARLSVYSAKHRIAVIFLKNMLKDTKNEKIAGQLKLRIKTLVLLEQLEKNVGDYKTKFNKMPSSLNDLVITGLIEKIPIDPYGGKFILLKTGRVYTTSKMLVQKK